MSAIPSLSMGYLMGCMNPAAASALVFAMHWHNLMRAIRKEDPISAKGGFQKIFGKKE